MGVYIDIEKPKDCIDCPIRFIDEIPCKPYQGLSPYDGYMDCPLIEIDLERDIPTVWYNRQTGQYEPKGTKQEVYERLYKLKNGERRTDPNNCKECEFTNECDHHICIKAVRERRTDETDG